MIKVREVRIVKGVMADDVLPVAMFSSEERSCTYNIQHYFSVKTTVSLFEVNLNVGNLGKSVASDALQGVNTTL